MWHQWDEAIVQRDLTLLSRRGLRTLRVFPLWSDFQPLHLLYGEFGVPRETRLGEQPLPHDIWGRAGIDTVMIDRFETFCRIAQAQNLHLTVMLLTGWMSGRQFKPEPLQSLNTYTDSVSLQWQVRFVAAFVEHFRDYPAIIAWGLGNESNVMSRCPSPAAAYTWTALIRNTIRAYDTTRPIISGMHGLTMADKHNPWRIQDQGELCDVMTIHPYAHFIPHCSYDGLISVRGTLHPAAELTLYADLTGRPCMTEEFGDLGRTFTDAQNSKLYAKNLLWSSWSHNSLGCLWWCAFQQKHLKEAPYDWFAFEQELGLFEADHTPRPVAEAFVEFQRTLNKLPPSYHLLPPRRRDAVCILSQGQDTWPTALATFILAKQAGFDIVFTGPDAPLPPSDCYLAPCLSGTGPLSSRQWRALLQRVEHDGASLYLSIFDAMMPNLADIAGVRIKQRLAWRDRAEIYFDTNTNNSNGNGNINGNHNHRHNHANSNSNDRGNGSDNSSGNGKSNGTGNTNGTSNISGNDNSDHHYFDNLLTLPAVGMGYDDLSPRAATTDANPWPARLILETTGAEILARDGDGAALFTRFTLGRGTVYFLAFGLEILAAVSPGAFEVDAPPYSRIYRTVAAGVLHRRLARKTTPDQTLALTEHPLDDHTTVLLGVNHAFREIKTSLQMDASVTSAKVLWGNATVTGSQISLDLPSAEGFVLELCHSPR